MAKASGVAIGVFGCLGVVVAGLIVGFTALFYFGFVQRGGVYDGLRVRLNQSTLNDLMPKIELYKIEHGVYPDTLEQLAASATKSAPVMIYDATITGLSATPREFFYRRVGCDHYYLRAVGPDNIPFTADDLIPDIDSSSQAKLGLLMQRQPADEVACKTG